MRSARATSRARQSAMRSARPGSLLLGGASLALIAGGIVAAALWFVWLLAEIVP